MHYINHKRIIHTHTHIYIYQPLLINLITLKKFLHLFLKDHDFFIVMIFGNTTVFFLLYFFSPEALKNDGEKKIYTQHEGNT